jgi:hypothetical protein
MALPQQCSTLAADISLSLCQDSFVSCNCDLCYALHGLQEDFKRQLAQLHSDVEVAVLHATAPLQKQLKGKADVSQLTSSSSSLEARLSSSEKSLLLGLKSVGDKAALLLQHKADVAALEDWKQQVGDELCAVKAQLATQQAAIAAAVVKQGQPQISSAPVPDVQGSSSSRGHHLHDAQQAAGALEVFTALTAGQVDGSTEAGDVAAVAKPAGAKVEPAEDCCSSTAASTVEAMPVLPAVGVPAAAAAAETATVEAPQHSSAVDACASSSSTAPAVAVAVATGSGFEATIVRPLTTSKRQVSPARTQTPGSPNAPAASSNKQRPPSMQPWQSSNASQAAVAELLSAAHNAKLAKAARDKELARARLGDSRALVAAMVQSAAVPAAEEVADALQQQLNVLGLTSPRAAARAGAAAKADSSSGPGAGGVNALSHSESDGAMHLAGDAGVGKQAAAAAGGMLANALAARKVGTAGASAVVAAGASGTVDGSGRLVGMNPAAAQLFISSPGSAQQCQADRGDAARAQLTGALSASGVTYSLRLQSAGAQQHSNKAASGVARTSSVGALPAVSTGNMSGGSSNGDGAQLLRQAPTAEGLRALLRGNSAHGSSKGSSCPAAGAVSQQLPAADGRCSSSDSRHGSGSKECGQDASSANVGRASPLALMKQHSSQSGSLGGSSSRNKSD